MCDFSGARRAIISLRDITPKNLISDFSTQLSSMPDLAINGKVAIAVTCNLISLGPRPSFIFGFERAWYAKIRHVTSFWTSVGVSMETPPFTMTLFQSAYGQVAAWCEYSSSETDGRIAS